MGGHAYGGGERVPGDSRGRPPAAGPRRAEESRERQERPGVEHRRRLRDQRRSGRGGLAVARQSPAPWQVRIADGRERRGLLLPPVQARPARRKRREHRGRLPAAPGLRLRRARRKTSLGAAGRRRQLHRCARRRFGEGGAGAARGRAAHRGDVPRARQQHSAGLASVGSQRADAEGGLHGHHPACRAPGPARQHAGPVRSHLQAAASPAGLLWRLHHGFVLPAATAAGLPDRHIQLDGERPAGAGGRRAGRADASARLRRRDSRGLLRCRRARRAQGIHRREGGALRRRRNRHRRRPAVVRRRPERPDRSADRGHRLPHAMARAGAAVSGDHDSRRRRGATSMGRSRYQ